MYPMLSQDILGYCSVYLRILRDMLVRGQDQMLSSVAFKVGRAVLCISAEGPAGIMSNTYYIITYSVFSIPAAEVQIGAQVDARDDCQWFRGLLCNRWSIFTSSMHMALS